MHHIVLASAFSSFSKLRCFQRARFDNFSRVTQYASLVPFSYENRYSTFLAIFEIHSDKPLSRPKIYRWFKKLEGKASNELSKSFQMRMGLEIVDELMEIVGQNPCCTSKCLTKFLNCRNNTIMGRLKEFGYQNMW